MKRETALPNHVCARRSCRSLFAFHRSFCPVKKCLSARFVPPGAKGRFYTSGPFHTKGEGCDRFIIATALAKGMPVVTADKRFTQYGLEGPLAAFAIGVLQH
jgi:hypothetical protein